MNAPARGTTLWLAPDGFHLLSFTIWGPADSADPPVMCVHGLTRAARDFDVLAAALAASGRRVICPDMPGRGESERLNDPRLYLNPTYALACAHLIAMLGGAPVDWVGTSMGGLIGMDLASRPGSPIRRMVLNDIGPAIPHAALARIGTYLGLPIAFPDFDSAVAHVSTVHAPFGPLSDAEWRHLATASMRQHQDGQWRPIYDPAIAVPFQDLGEADFESWALWEALDLPMLVLRGEASDLLMAETAERMAGKPRVRIATIPHCGHAPALMDANQVALVAGFLAQG